VAGVDGRGHDRLRADAPVELEGRSEVTRGTGEGAGGRASHRPWVPRWWSFDPPRTPIDQHRHERWGRAHAAISVDRAVHVVVDVLVERRGGASWLTPGTGPSML